VFEQVSLRSSLIVQLRGAGWREACHAAQAEDASSAEVTHLYHKKGNERDTSVGTGGGLFFARVSRSVH
jgi:hypothetical protein